MAPSQNEPIFTKNIDKSDFIIRSRILPIGYERTNNQKIIFDPIILKLEPVKRGDVLIKIYQFASV